MSNSTQNDHGTHTSCIDRINIRGASATCCYCDPHEGCTLGERLPEASKTILNDWEKLLEFILSQVEQLSSGLARKGGNYPNPKEQIKSLFRQAQADARREMVREIEKMKKQRFPLPGDPRKITERYEIEREYEIWKIGYNEALKDVQATLRKEENGK